MSRDGSSMIVLVTGATGFLGSRVVAVALERGHRVIALARDAGRLGSQPWSGRPEVERVVLDLSAPDADVRLGALMPRLSAVIHAASSLGGDDRIQGRDTVDATTRLLAAMQAASPRPRLVLASSFSVYDFASLPRGATLDETTSLEQELDRRDAYFRGKRAQERLSMEVAQHGGVPVRAMRIGALIGPGRRWTARLGWRLGPVVLCPGGGERVPVIEVDDAALALVLASERPLLESDLPLVPGAAPWEAINVVASRLPTRRGHLRASRRQLGVRLVLPVPGGPIAKIVRAASLAVDVLPGVSRLVPRIARAETFDARFKPLRFSNARLMDRLGWTPRDDP